jgi:hypothetical protein
LEPGHAGQHPVVPAHRLIWQISHHDSLLNPDCVVRPINGDWNDLHPGNLECVTRKDHWRDLYAASDKREKRGWRLIDGNWYCRCKDCDEWLPADAFDPKRQVCKGCRRAQKRKAAKARYRSASFSYDGQTYCLGSFGEPPTGAESSDALYFLMACLDRQFLSETDGDLAAVRACWASILSSLSA